VAHAIDLLVDRGFLLDVGVSARDVGLGLVVVVVGYEVLDRVVGKEALHLSIKLCGKRLVGCEDQRRALGGFDHLGHGEGLARSRNAQQDLVAVARGDAGHEFADGMGLVAFGRQFRNDLETTATLGFLGAAWPMWHEGFRRGGRRRGLGGSLRFGA
jgi:hypothetical protein